MNDQKPDFLAVHFQEVGGKNYEESMIHVELFVRTILDSNELKEYDKVCILLDEDFTNFEKFTVSCCCRPKAIASSLMRLFKIPSRP